MALILSAALPCHSDNAPTLPSGKITLYVNGVLQATADCNSAWNATGHSVIGRGLFASKPADFTNGMIADARLYDRALTSAQIESLYAKGLDPHWQFDRTQHGGSAANRSDQWQFLGGATWLANKNDGVLAFNGVDASVDVGQSVLDTSRSYTVSAWVLLNKLDGYQTFVSQDGKALSGFYLQKRGDDNKFALSVRAADSVDAPVAVAASKFAPRANVLYHVVGVYESASDSPLLSWDAARQGRFIQSLAQDRQGHTWVATEGQGVWRYDAGAPADKRWTQFTQKDGLGSDDVYALLVDAHNRLWAGTLRGASVYNGKGWKTYGPLEGLGGFRVCALASCPTNGDVWIATEGGLTRYLLKQDRWRAYSRLDGLPSDAISSLAFRSNGDVFVGTQADGIAVSTAKSAYRTWRIIPSPRETPRAAGGTGLPTGLVNCLLASRAGTVYAGTDDGLARSEDGGKHWRFLRGVDWKAKAQGDGAALVDNADVRALEVLPLDDPRGRAVRINAGGKAEGAFGADTDFEGGDTFHSNDPVDTKAVPNAAPQEAYRTARWGSFTYTIPGLRPNARYRVRLHLAEVAFTEKGRRVFSVSLNGQPALADFDIFAEAGGKNKAIVRESTTWADGRGRVVLAFQGAQSLPSRENAYALLEDYVTCLAEDAAGHLLVGHRSQGLEVIDLKSGTRLFPTAADKPPTDFVMALLPRPDGTTLLGGYGGGLVQTPLPGSQPAPAIPAPLPAAEVSSLPSPAKPPTLAELNALLKMAEAVPPDAHEYDPHAVAVADDWQTEGEWLGRHGRYWACFPALFHPIPLDYLWGAGWEPVDYDLAMGPNHAPGDSLRYWLQTRYTDEAHCLELPPTYLDSRVRKGYTTWDKDRRDTSVDDHGETMPTYTNGPNIHATVAVPSGLYYLSLYFFNRQTVRGGTSDRDYRLSVRPYVGTGRTDFGGFNGQPEWARGRVSQYYPGVWKRFLVRGPQTVTVEVNRNHSWNTELDGVMLDLVDERPAPYFQTVDQWKTGEAQKEKQWRTRLAEHSLDGPFKPAASASEAADRLRAALSEAQTVNSSWWAAHGRRFYGQLLRWYAAQASAAPGSGTGLASELGACEYQMGLYPEWEQSQQRAGLRTARQVEKGLRWDETTQSNSGRGYEVVTAHLAGQAGTEKQAMRESGATVLGKPSP